MALLKPRLIAVRKKTLAAIDKGSLPINAVVAALKTLPAEAKPWRMVPQLLVQVFNVISVRDAVRFLKCANLIHSSDCAAERTGPQLNL